MEQMLPYSVFVQHWSKLRVSGRSNCYEVPRTWILAWFRIAAGIDFTFTMAIQSSENTFGFRF